ncbi:MAG: hypothetical protein J7K51_08740 [Thermotogae bacterium]|nr:hypothetical protein [Thermotogota bacterium]
MQRNHTHKKNRRLKKIWLWIIALLIIGWVGYINYISLFNYVKTKKRYEDTVKKYENKVNKLKKYKETYEHLYRIYDEINNSKEKHN